MAEKSLQQALLETVVKAMVSRPEEVRIELTTTEESGSLVMLYVSGEDMGRVLGRRGSTANALRTVFNALGEKGGERLSLQVCSSGDAHGQGGGTSSIRGRPEAITPRPSGPGGLPKISSSSPRSASTVPAAPVPMSKGHEERVAMVESRLDVEFVNKSLLIEALTHRSYLNENLSHPTGHNERLEFLGDAVVEIVVTEMLYKKYPKTREGDLTTYRTALVCGDTLGALFESLGLWDALFLSRGEMRLSQESTKSRKYICANAFEAMIGALYLDQGLGTCRFALDHLLHLQMKRILASFRDYKSELQELLQARFEATPRYELLKEEGPDHEKVFTVACVVEGIRISEGVSDSKQGAQTAAAKAAHETISQWEGRIVEAAWAASATRRSTNRNGGES